MPDTSRRSSADWAAAGFLATHPVAPPGAKPAPNSAMAGGKGIGKAPAALVEGSEDLWRGLRATERTRRGRARKGVQEDFERAFAAGANRGLEGWAAPALDIDCPDSGWAEKVAQIAHKVLGPGPVRTGRAPKRAILYRWTRPEDAEQARATLRRVWTWVDDAGVPQRVEIIGAGQQLVVEGTHPETKRPYAWDVHPVDAADAGLLSAVTTEDLRRLYRAVKAAVEAAGLAMEEAGTASPSSPPKRPEELVSRDPEGLHRAVATTMQRIADREAWIAFGHALRGAFGGDHAHLGLELWWQQADLYGEQGEDVETTFDSLNPTHAGAEHLARLARRWGFEGTLPDLLPFDVVEAEEGMGDAGEGAASPGMAPLWKPADLNLNHHRRRREVVANLAPRGELAILAGQGGAGKTVTALTVVAHAACGRAFGPFAPDEGKPVRSLIISAEEPREAVEQLLAAAAARHMIPREMVAGNVLIRADADCRLVVEERGGGVVATPLLRRIEAAVTEHRVDLIVADPAVHVIALNNENDNQMVGAGLAVLRAMTRRTGASLLLLHHTPKVSREQAARSAGEATLIRGGSAWTGAARLAATLTADPSLAHDGPPPLLYRVAKRNDAPLGPGCRLRLVGVPLALADGMATVRTAVMIGEDDPDQPFDAEAVAAILRALMAGRDGRGRPYDAEVGARSPTGALRLAMRHLPVARIGATAERHAGDLLARLRKAGVLRVETQRDHRRNRNFLALVVDEDRAIGEGLLPAGGSEDADPAPAAAEMADA